MSSYLKVLSLVAAAAAISACKKEVTSSTAASVGTEDVTGSYFAADSGHNLGKDWCYSAALVLDSTHHFGSVIRVCSDDGSGPVTDTLKGTYTLRASTVKTDNGARVRKLNVILRQGEGRHKKKHTLVYANGALKFDEPWWMGAGLRALEIGDPTLRRVSTLATSDSTPAAASSTSGKSATPKKKI